MPLREIRRICDCRECLENTLSLAELQMLAQQQDQHMVRHDNRSKYKLPLV